MCQVNGKVRDRIQVSVGTDQDTAVNQARGLANVAKYLDSGTLRKTIFVQDKLILGKSYDIMNRIICIIFCEYH